MKILRVLALCFIVLASNAQRSANEAGRERGAVQPYNAQRNPREGLRDIVNKLRPILLGFMQLQRTLDKVTSETKLLHAGFKNLAPLEALKEVITQVTNVRNRLLTEQPPAQADSASAVQDGENSNQQVYTLEDKVTGEIITVDAHPEALGESEFLNEHNFYRRRLREGTDPDGESVPGLADLVWDEELAEECRNWARTCVYQYAKNITAEENLACTTDVIGDPVQIWYQYRHKTGHYRKMVSPTAVYLGCHMTHCPVLQIPKANSRQENAFYTVCRYSSTKTTPQIPTE